MEKYYCSSHLLTNWMSWPVNQNLVCAVVKLRSGADINVLVANRTEDEAEFYLCSHVLLPDHLVEPRKEMSWGQVRGPLRFHLFPSSVSPAGLLIIIV